jgi:hypothetical protein
LLAYELYLKSKNKNRDSGPKASRPIKKVFVRADPLKIELDSKTLDEYGGTTLPETEILQEILSMPLSNQAHVGLPDRTTGTASKRPYITLYGSYRNGILEIQMKGASKKGKERRFFNFVAHIDGDEVREEPFRPKSRALTMRLDTKHYRLPTMTLFEAYRKDRVIDGEGSLSYEVFHGTCKHFAEFCRKRKIADNLEGSKREPRFGLVILPHSMLSKNQVVEYVEEQDERPIEHFTDAFGTESTGYSSKTTQTAKFLSFDDPAFTINCTKGSDFYANLGIGRESLQNTNLISDDCFTIAGFLWYFMDLTNPNFVFERTNSGIYDQLRANYEQLRKKKGSFVMSSVMKTTCLKKTQAKLEVLLDENLTMNHLEEILYIEEFERIGQRFHPMALETLITKPRGRSSKALWNDYLSAVGHLIHGIPMDRRLLVNAYSKILRENLLSWINDLVKGVDSTNRFFEKSAFCMKLLTRISNKMIEMNENEEYAYTIGRIAGRYVQFRRDRGEAARSSADILTYTKYDRDRLRHVYSRVCTGVCLETSTAATLSAQEKNMHKFLEENAPQKEMDDGKAYEDYSYFFYRGVFESQKEGGGEKK